MRKSYSSRERKIEALDSKNRKCRHTEAETAFSSWKTFAPVCLVWACQELKQGLSAIGYNQESIYRLVSKLGFYAKYIEN